MITFSELKLYRASEYPHRLDAHELRDHGFDPPALSDLLAVLGTDHHHVLPPEHRVLQPVQPLSGLDRTDHVMLVGYFIRFLGVVYLLTVVAVFRSASFR